MRCMIKSVEAGYFLSTLNVYITLHYVTSRHVTLCHAMIYYDIYHIMIYYIMIYYIMIYYIMIYYTMIYYHMSQNPDRSKCIKHLKIWLIADTTGPVGIGII